MLIGFGDRKGFLELRIQRNMLIYINICIPRRRFVSLAQLVNRVWFICKMTASIGGPNCFKHSARQYSQSAICDYF